MKTFTEKYNEVMKHYRDGDYEKGGMTLAEILGKAGYPDLFDSATLEELQDFQKKAVGVYSKMAWGCAIREWEKKHNKFGVM